MCGIVFKHNFDKNKPVNNDILQQYDAQSHRGKQGYGIFDGQYMNIIRESREDNILKWLVKKNSNLILFHHRMPTSTVNVARCAHPFSTKKYFGKVEYILVHNGVIRNATNLWTAHQALKINYTSLLEDLSFNDSEALLWDFALTIEGKQPEMKAYGNMAFIVMKKINGKLVSMMYGRNTNPLNIRRTSESLELSSEGKGVSTLPNTLYEFNFRTHVTSKKPMVFPAQKPYESTGNWNHRPQESGTYPNSGFRPQQQQSLLPARTGADVREFDSYDEWYSARHEEPYGVKSKTAGAPPIVDPESNWQRLRRKYGTGNGKIVTANDMNTEELTKDIADVLKSRKIDDASMKSIGQILDAKRDKSGKFVVAEVQHSQVIDMDSVDLRDFSPTTPEIQNCAMEFMIEAQGVFENAYALLELNYAEYMDEVAKNGQSFDSIRQTLLFESAMEFINSDPEYENEKSVSSIWQALWFQKQVTQV